MKIPLFWLHYSRGVFRTKSSIYDGTVLEKKLKAASYFRNKALMVVTVMLIENNLMCWTNVIKILDHLVRSFLYNHLTLTAKFRSIMKKNWLQGKLLFLKKNSQVIAADFVLIGKKHLIQAFLVMDRCLFFKFSNLNLKTIECRHFMT